MARTNEWEFAGKVASWVNERLATEPGKYAVGAARTERPVTARGRSKRHDLIFYLRSHRLVPVLTGEIKLPYNPDGRSPYDDKLITDAHSKAAKVNASYFFTWNVNRFALFKTNMDVPLNERCIKLFEVVKVRSEADLLHPQTEKTIRDRFVPNLLAHLSQLIDQQIVPVQLPLDEMFLARIEAALDDPVGVTRDELVSRYFEVKDAPFISRLNQWMRKQGLHVLEDEETIQSNLDTVAKSASYGVLNKLAFYEALRRRFSKLAKLSVPKRIKQGEELRAHLETYFRQAERESKDYETIFQDTYADRLPFLSDEAVPAWQRLIEQIEKHDFTRLDYDIIGGFFERLLSPEERHKYGQHYTRREIVDLINAFCIEEAGDAVLDPACGSGTFLVRAYARKRYLARGALGHAELLAGLFGVDTSPFAAHLTTLNLAVRDLVDAANYPRIVQKDFFDVRKGVFRKLPIGGQKGEAKAKGLGAGEEVNVNLEQVDAVVGNPPYVRQEELTQQQKAHYAGLIGKEWQGLKLSGRSDLHVYFWPHATYFLPQGGRFGFLTSSGWLDTEYGFHLQEWLLSNFRILAVFESDCEPWFTGARVATAATVVVKDSDAERRHNNLVRFVQLRRPLGEFVNGDGTPLGQLEAAERFRDEVLSIEGDVTREGYRVRVVRQGELYAVGCLPDKTGSLSYRGGKWGMYLRAPDLFFELREKYTPRFVRFSEAAEIKRGVTTGCDAFFFPRDVTAQALEEEPSAAGFREHYGVSRATVEAGHVRIVKAGDGTVWPIEAEYLEPEVHNLMEIDSLSIKPERLARQILLVSAPKDKLKGKHVLKYINAGEREPFGKEGGPVAKRSTCAGRVGEKRTWYDVTTERRGDCFWPKAQQYRHIIAHNEQRLICGNNLYDVFGPANIDKRIFVIVLNSTLLVLFKQQYGRLVGREGNLKTEVIDVELMPVPDMKAMEARVAERLLKVFDSMTAREIGPFVEERFLKAQRYADVQGYENDPILELPAELRQEDRLLLDDAVLELLGEPDRRERERLREALYREVTLFYRRMRLLELQAIENKLRTAKRRGAAPRVIVEQIWTQFDKEGKLPARRVPFDFIPRGAATEPLELPPSSAEPVVEQAGLFDERRIVKIGKRAILCVSEPQARLVARLLRMHFVGTVELPKEPKDCELMLRDLGEYLAEWADRFKGAATDVTANEGLIERVLGLLMGRLISV